MNSLNKGLNNPIINWYLRGTNTNVNARPVYPHEAMKIEDGAPIKSQRNRFLNFESDR